MAEHRTPEVISTSEAARRLGVCQRTIWRRIKRGEIQAVKIIREYAVAADSLDPGVPYEHSH